MVDRYFYLLIKLLESLYILLKKVRDKRCTLTVHFQELYLCLVLRNTTLDLT